MQAILSVLDLFDYVGLVFFLAGWFSYVRFAHWKARQVPSLLGVLNTYRRMWMERVVSRENRMVDASLLGGLMNSATFLASTTVLILGGLIAMLGTTETVVVVVGELPFARPATQRAWEIKILLLIGIFVYAFFKYTWSMRQFNMLAILIGAAPPHTVEPDPSFVNRAAEIVILAGENFNNGLRAYYFGLGAMTWLLHPGLLIISMVWTVAVLYRREFRSEALKTLVRGGTVTEAMWLPASSGPTRAPESDR